MDKEVWSLAEGSAALKRGRERRRERKTGTESQITRFHTDDNGPRERIRGCRGTARVRHRGCGAIFSSTVARAGSIAGRSCPSQCRCTNKLLHLDTKSPRRRQYPTQVHFFDSNRLGSGYTPSHEFEVPRGRIPRCMPQLPGRSDPECTPHAIPDSPAHSWASCPPRRHPLRPACGQLIQRVRYLLPTLRPFDRSTSFGGVRGPGRGRSESTSWPRRR
jgi:hypothetical protein